MLQGRDGYIWIGTYEGLLRFDGVHFESFSPKNYSEMLHGTITTLCEAPDGSIWFGGGGPGLYRYANGEIQAFGEAEGMSLEVVERICIDANSNVYVSSLSNIYRLQPEPIATRLPFDAESHHTQITDIELDKDSGLWIGTNDGLWHLRPESLHAERVEGLGQCRIVDLKCVNSEAIWATTFDGGVYRIRNGTLEKIMQGTMGEFSAIMTTDPSGDLWISGGAGIRHFHDETFEVVKVPEIFTDKIVTLFLIDREGSFWVVSSDLRLYQIKLPKFEFHSYFNGLPDCPLSGIARVEDRLFASTFNGIYEKKGDHWEPFHALVGVLRKMDRMLAADGLGNLWVCSQSNGLLRYNVKEDSLRIFTEEIGLPYNEPRCITTSHDGTMWVGTEKGVYTIQNETLRKREEFPSKKILCIAETPDRSIWVGVFGEGFYQLKDGSVTRYNREIGLASNIPFYAHQVGEDEFWLSTNAGLSRLKQGKLTTINSKQGLPRDSVFYTINDETGHTWIATNPGIYRLQTKALRHAFDTGEPIEDIDFFDSSDGVPSSSMLAPSTPFYDRETGKYWLASLLGAWVIEPAKSPAKLPAPSVHIEYAVLDGKRIPVGNHVPVMIDADTKRVNIYFSAPSFYSPEKVSFRVKLQGFDDKWITTSERMIAYSGLAPGNYILDVHACSSDGVWTDIPASLRLVKLPSFTQTGAFKISLVVLVLVITGLITFTYNYQLERRKQMLTERVKERTAELNEALQAAQAANLAKSNFLAMMSHEIRTPMNGVVGMLDIILDSSISGKNREYAVSAKQSARSLMSILNDILDLAKIESNQMMFEAIDFSLHDTATETLQMLTPFALEKNIDLRSDIESIRHLFLQGDPVRIRQVLVNLINNAIKFTDIGGVSLVIRAHALDSSFARIEIKVIDTGIGIKEENQRRIFDTFDQGDLSYKRKYGGSGLGLSICKRIVDHMGGEISCSSRINIGSTFSVNIKLPLAKQRDDQEPLQESLREGSGNRTLKILLVEDVKFNQTIIKHAIAKLGHTVVCVWNGLQALDALSTTTFDLILMDISMPEMDGLETTARIRNGQDGIPTAIPIIALTANAMRGDREKFIEAGMNGYLSKPIEPSELKKTLDAFSHS